MKDVRQEVFPGKAYFFHTKGYLDAELGASVVSLIQEALLQQAPILVLSLAESPLINSLGMAKLIEAIEVSQNADCELWFADLTPLHEKTLAASGVLPIIARTTTVAKAKQELGLTGATAAP